LYYPSEDPGEGKVLRAMLGRRLSAYGVRCTAVILLLLGHLVLMASPLHAMLMEQGQSPVAVTAAAFGDSGLLAPPSPQPSCVETCMAGWTPLSARLLITLLAGLLVAIVVRIQVGQLRQRQLPVRVLGPPPRGDSQALLQVFRI
jgi:hypothetical protein